MPAEIDAGVLFSFRLHSWPSENSGGLHPVVARVSTVAFQGIDVLDVDVQVQTTSGLPVFTMLYRIDRYSFVA